MPPPRFFYPFRYSDVEWIDLGALTIQQYPDPAGQLRTWTQASSAPPQRTLSLLKDLSAGVSEYVSYQSRDDEGTRSPIQTLDRRWAHAGISPSSSSKWRAASVSERGSCPAILPPDQNGVGSAGAGSTHAWAEIFIPGEAGSRSIRPTAVSVASISSRLRSHAISGQATPVSGSFVGTADAFQGMSIEVRVTSQARE